MGTHVAGVMVVGKDLYVKWRIKSTGQILEDTVDLRSRLPLSINKHQLRFIIEDKQLFVYLISYEPVRPYFSQAEADRIRLSHVTLRQKAFDFSLRNRVTLIYPEKQIDPHVPADFRK